MIMAAPKLAVAVALDLPFHGMRIIKSIAISIFFTLTACSPPDEPTIGLYLAIHRGDIDQIERHIQWDSDINQVDADGRRPLHVAAERGRLAVVRLLIKHGADLDALDRQGNTALYSAVMAGRTQVALLLIKNDSSIDADQLLNQAVANGVTDRDVIRFLLDQGAEINHQDEMGRTPLIMAISYDNRIMVKLLIANGADVNKPDSSGKTPLMLANERKITEIIRLLKRNGARTGPEI